MSVTKTFETIRKTKRLFDPISEVDKLIYREYLRNKGWGVEGCPFILEFPHLTIPNMINAMLIHQFLGV